MLKHEDHWLPADLVIQRMRLALRTVAALVGEKERDGWERGRPGRGSEESLECLGALLPEKVLCTPNSEQKRARRASAPAAAAAGTALTCWLQPVGCCRLRAGAENGPIHNPNVGHLSLTACLFSA